MFLMSEEMMYDEFVFFARWLVPSVDRYKATNYSELIIFPTNIYPEHSTEEIRELYK